MTPLLSLSPSATFPSPLVMHYLLADVGDYEEQAKIYVLRTMDYFKKQDPVFPFPGASFLLMKFFISLFFWSGTYLICLRSTVISYVYVYVRRRTRPFLGSNLDIPVNVFTHNELIWCSGFGCGVLHVCLCVCVCIDFENAILFS